MRLIAEKTLKTFAGKYATAAPALSNFVGIVKAANWKTMDDIVQTGVFSPSPVGNERIVFNIGGNNFRLICNLDFARGVVYVKWFGTHAEYDKIDANTATLF